MANTIRGDGLFTAYATLAALAEDSGRLERARHCFSNSPSSDRLSPSGITTRSQSPDLQDDEEQRRGLRKWQLAKEHRASMPRWQFGAQTYEEERRILQVGADASGMGSIPNHVWMRDSNVTRLAKKAIKERWVEQGIWDDEWEDMRLSGPWKHEEPLELESERNPPLFSHRTVGAKPRRSKSDEELRLLAERRATRKREHEASRPIYQWFYYLSKERERMEDEWRSKGQVALDAADVNTKAYEKVKNTWIERGIWSKKWGILPGMSWKHEHPLNDMLAEVMGPNPGLHPAKLPQIDCSREAIPPPRRIFGTPSPAKLNTGFASDSLDTFQEVPGGLDRTELQNGNAVHSSGGANLRRHHSEDARSVGQKPRQGKKAPSTHKRRAQPREGNTLHSVLPAKVSKASITRKRHGSRQLGNTLELISKDGPAQTDLNLHNLPPVAAPPIPTQRSARIQTVQPTTSTDPAAGVPAYLLNSTQSFNSRRTTQGTAKSSREAKPTGVLKRQRRSSKPTKS